MEQVTKDGLTKRIGSKVSLAILDDQENDTKSPSLPLGGRSRTSIQSWQPQNGMPLEKQGRPTALMGPLWIYRWCAGTIIAVILIIANSTGFVLPVSAHSGEWIVIVLTEISVLLYSSLPNRLVDQSIRCWSGRRISVGKGSLTVVGYLHTGVLQRSSFLSSLSYRSELRKKLTYIAWLQILLESLHVLAIVAGVGANLQDSVDVRTSVCYIPAVDGSPRGITRIPGYEYATGATEYTTSTAMGHTRVDGYPFSVGVIGPTLTGFGADYVVHGTSLLMSVNSTCFCGAGTASEWRNLYADAQLEAGPIALPNVNLHVEGGVTLATVPQPMAEGLYILNQELYDGDLCGGSISRLMCAVKAEITVGQAAIQYSASSNGISPAVVGVGEITDTGIPVVPNDDFVVVLSDWYTTMNDTKPLSRTAPNAVPPLLSWLSSSDGGLSLSLGEPGMDMLNIMLMKQALSITGAVAVSTCTVTTSGSGSAVLLGKSSIVILATLGIATLTCGMGLYFMAYQDDKVPSRLALCSRVHFDLAAMIQVSSQSDHLRLKLANMCNAESPDIWNALDHHSSIGETIHTLDDEVGHITVGTAKTIRPLQFGRRYAGGPKAHRI
ncbi:hypothetical protein, variant [Spizellomyces punctatus DAOM BR117]|uniref:Uncharacterized protein n=2 Tax=Spizellomyces punctatus (strain DAOM BR117) TaxID=645134 RepID=A0A0L0H4C7_SPIPD|nr:hypothetical protein, variant [Spizellomyces punctatus DAOM BR117]KNC96057.1 hypothetical protein, variant [Spizellomyces punctatus DAOM BR117]|eukprot:XP_016604097.1 hypothetical protein, variant [Spizellomyces punctatus DAOM BR117]